MSCILGQDAAGNRFIACTRGGRRVVLENKDPAALVPPASPWQIGKKVKHKIYGAGKIIHRGAEWMEIDFQTIGVKRFIIEFVGSNIEVIQ